MVNREPCPQCGSKFYKRNGHMHTGKQNRRCKLCGRAFVLTPDNAAITDEQRALVERLLRERISLRGICRVMSVGFRWLLHFTVKCFEAAPAHLNVQFTTGTPAVILQRLEAEMDELWSFVGKKTNRHWGNGRDGAISRNRKGYFVSSFALNHAPGRFGVKRISANGQHRQFSGAEAPLAPVKEAG